MKIEEPQKKFKGLINFVQDSRRKKQNWAGFISRVEDERWGYKSLHWTPEGKRGKGKPKARREDDLETFFKSKLFYRIVQDRAE